MEQAVNLEEKKRGIFGCYIEAFKKYFQFSGRASRYEYWSFILIDWLVSILFAICSIKLSHIVTVYALLSFIPSLAVSFRRLHDVGKSGWYITAPWLLLVVGYIAFAIPEYAGYTSAWYTVIGGIICVGCVAVMFLAFCWKCMKGSSEANKYGAPVQDDDAKGKTIMIIVVACWVLLVGGVMLIGGISGYSKAMKKYKMNQTAEQINMLVTNIRTMYIDEETYTSLNNSVVSAEEMVTPDMYDKNGELSNVYDGKIVVLGDEDKFSIVYENLPQEDCYALANIANSIPEWNVLSASCENCVDKKCRFRMISW